MDSAFLPHEQAAGAIASLPRVSLCQRPETRGREDRMSRHDFLPQEQRRPTRRKCCSCIECVGGWHTGHRESNNDDTRLSSPTNNGEMQGVGHGASGRNGWR